PHLPSKWKEPLCNLIRQYLLGNDGRSVITLLNVDGGCPLGRHIKRDILIALRVIVLYRREPDFPAKLITRVVLLLGDRVAQTVLSREWKGYEKQDGGEGGDSVHRTVVSVTRITHET